MLFFYLQWALFIHLSVLIAEVENAVKGVSWEETSPGMLCLLQDIILTRGDFLNHVEKILAPF